MLPLISIILPVYNMSGKLPRCIASLTAQTYPNLEFLFVDDGSTDNSVQVIQQYADSRFRILRKKNGGVSSARNEGLRNMRGEYGAFVDPDDTVSPNYIQYLYDALMAQGTKMSCCWTYELHEDDVDKPLPDEPHQPAKLATFDNYDQWGEMAHVQSYGVLYHHDLLENLRFDPREEKNDPEFARELASMAELYVSDAFGTVHRAHASTAGVAAFLPAVSGLLVARELEIMGGALENPKRPFVAVLGGAKVSDKIGVINNLLEKADTIIIGGGMAYTFARAQGGSIGKSLCEPDKLDYALQMIQKAKDRGVQLLLPTDIKDFPDPIDAPVDVTVVPVTAIPADMEGCDIGPETMKLFADAVKASKTVVWNGPMGVFEFEKFAAGTRAMAQALAGSGAITIVGGGDSAAAVEQMGFADKITHISTGGGASLEFLEGIELPGVACLLDK